jgi:restriction system protein
MGMRDARGPMFLRFVPPIVDTLRELGGAGLAGEVADSVIARLGISAEDAAVPTSNGQSRVRNQINWARFYLAKAGYLSAPKRGVWKLTERGQQATMDADSVRALFKDVQDGFDDDEPAEPSPPIATIKFKGPRMVFSDHPLTPHTFELCRPGSYVDAKSRATS